MWDGPTTQKKKIFSNTEGCIPFPYKFCMDNLNFLNSNCSPPELFPKHNILLLLRSSITFL